MSTEDRRCIAITKTGTRCRNKALPGNDYCYVHRHVATAAPLPPETATATPAPTPSPSPPQDQLLALTAELNDLVADLQKLTPEYAPPPFTRQRLLKLIKDQMRGLTPGVRLDALRELQESFEGTTARDFLDIETWKGMWFVLNYLAQSESEALKDRLANRLLALPGFSVLADWQESLEGTSPRDLLDPEVWKGMWYMLHYSVQFQAEAMKRRLFGSGE